MHFFIHQYNDLLICILQEFVRTFSELQNDIKISRKIFIGCRSMFDTQQSNVDLISIDYLYSGQKAARLIVRHIDFHFVRLDFQRDLQS